MQKRLISALVLIAYSAILIKVVVFKNRMGPPGRPLPETRHLMIRFAPNHANYVPFKSILPQLRGEPRWSTAIVNLVGNTVLFVPLGFLVPLVYRKMTWQKSLVLGVAVGLTMEGMEGLFRVGIVDIDDVILNAFSVMIGYGIFTFFERRRGNTAALARAFERRA